MASSTAIDIPNSIQRQMIENLTKSRITIVAHTAISVSFAVVLSDLVLSVRVDDGNGTMSVRLHDHGDSPWILIGPSGSEREFEMTEEDWVTEAAFVREIGRLLMDERLAVISSPLVAEFKLKNLVFSNYNKLHLAGCIFKSIVERCSDWHKEDYDFMCEIMKHVVSENRLGFGEEVANKLLTVLDEGYTGTWTPVLQILGILH